MRTLITAIALTVFSTVARGEEGIPFTSLVPETVEKSLSVPAGGNALDPLGGWTSSDLSLPENKSKGLEDIPPPRVHNFSIQTPDGVLVLSQLVDASCTNTECPSQVYLLKKNDKGETVKEVKIPKQMLPQNPLNSGVAKEKGLLGQATVSVAPDYKSITTLSIVDGKPVTQVIPFE